ncbi:MAG TPA: hypothetical protein VFS34_07985 [Thermoanaerobaculia bacterium]|nr:hypothetical protein [Thermoanaerobaculia bacterium]
MRPSRRNWMIPGIVLAGAVVAGASPRRIAAPDFSFQAATRIAGADGSLPMTAAGGTLFFSPRTAAPPGVDDLGEVPKWLAPRLLAVSHGDSTPRIVADFSGPDVDPADAPFVTILLAAGDRLLFTVGRHDGSFAFWTSDGTAAGTGPIPGWEFPAGSGIPWASPAPSGALLSVDRGGSGFELWSTAGTAATTTLLRAFGYAGVWRIDSAPLGGFTYFSLVQPDLRVDLWRTDGTPEGTTPVRTGISRYGESSFARAGDTLLLLGYLAGQNFWRSDGTAAGTEVFDQVYFPQSVGWAPSAGDRAYFFSSNAENDGQDELWTTDGTAAGTSRVSSVAAWWSAALGNSILFVADDGVHGREPWVTEGTPETTRMLADVVPGASGSNPSSFAKIADLVLFSADDGSGTGIWRTDGTSPGTWKVPDAHAGAAWNLVADFTQAGEDVYFVAVTGAEGALWRMPKSLLAPERFAAPTPVFRGPR